jgi:hypothetical protein
MELKAGAIKRSTAARVGPGRVFHCHHEKLKSNDAMRLAEREPWRSIRSSSSLDRDPRYEALEPQAELPK